MDPHLIGLSEVAEDGRHCPSVRLLVGSWLLSGTPVSTYGFLEACRRSFVTEFSASQEVRSMRVPADARDNFVRNAIAPTLATFSTPSASGEVGPVLNLVNVRVGGGVAGAYEVGAVRVAVSAVGAWWVVGHRVVPPPGARAGGAAVGLGLGLGLDF